MRKQDNLKHELEELSPLLNKLKAHDNPFKTPEGYFASLPDDVLVRLRMEKTQQPEKKLAQPGWMDQVSAFLTTLLQPRIAVSFAVVAVLVTTAVFWLRPETETADASSEQMALLSNLSTEEVSDYITENIEVFEEEELMVAVAESGVEIGNTLPAINLDAKDVEEYMEEAIQEMDDEDLESLF